MASWSREAGAAVLVKTGRPHRCARVRGGAHGQLPGGEALMSKGRNADEGAAGLSRNGLREQTAGLSKGSTKKGAKMSTVKNGAKGTSDMADGLGSRPGRSV